MHTSAACTILTSGWQFPVDSLFLPDIAQKNIYIIYKLAGCFSFFLILFYIFVFFFQRESQVFICWLLSFSPIIHALLESIPQDEWPWQIEYSLDTDTLAIEGLEVFLLCWKNIGWKISTPFNKFINLVVQKVPIFSMFFWRQACWSIFQQHWS